MKRPTSNELRDLWLTKYHNITSEEVAAKYPEEAKSGEWFRLFPVTQEQCDRWEAEAKQLLNKKYRLSKWEINREWPLIFLDLSPKIKE